jgi:hypothetical protein
VRLDHLLSKERLFPVGGERACLCVLLPFGVVVGVGGPCALPWWWGGGCFLAETLAKSWLGCVLPAVVLPVIGFGGGGGGCGWWVVDRGAGHPVGS